MQKIGCHLCQCEIFTNEAYPHSRYVGRIDKDCDINSIEWIDNLSSLRAPLVARAEMILSPIEIDDYDSAGEYDNSEGLYIHCNDDLWDNFSDEELIQILAN